MASTAAVGAAARYRVREASFQDYEQIIALQARYGLGTRSQEDWTQMWLGNPLYRELRNTWPIGWVLENGEGRIVASIGNMPLPYEWNGEKVVASSGISWVAEPEYRGAALLLLDMVVNQSGVDLYLNSTVTKESQEAIEAFQCLRVPVGRWDERAFWVTGHRGFAASLLLKKGWRAPAFWSYPLAAASLARGLIDRRAALKRSAAVEIRTAFDTRFEAFWKELRKQSRNQLLAVRSLEVLNWHFGDSLRNSRIWIAAVSAREHLLAYAVFDRRDNPKYRLKRARLIDFQCLDGHEELLQPLLASALQKCRKEGIHMLENVGRWLEDGDVVAASAPYRSKLYAWSYFYRADNPQLAERLKSPSAWAPSLYDGNASL